MILSEGQKDTAVLQVSSGLVFWRQASNVPGECGQKLLESQNFCGEFMDSGDNSGIFANESI